MAKILVIDDEEHIQQLLKEELYDSGYDPVIYDFRSSLIDTIRAEHYDLIILDINLGDGEDGGLVLLQQIRSEFYDMPIIIYSGYDRYRDSLKIIPADYYVTKSANLTELKLQIKRCLEAEASRPRFDSLTFGYHVAERDIKVGLYDYFVEFDPYRYAANGIKQIILGNRGTGKSAIVKVLTKREQQAGSIVIELSPDEFSYELIKDTLPREDLKSWARQNSYTAAWKYLIYVQVMKEFARSHKGMQTDSSKKIYEYIRDHHKGVELHPIAALISYIKRIEGVKLGKYEAGIKARELTNLYKLEEIKPLIPEVNAMCKRRKALVVIDELDKGWDGSEESKNFVAGLFEAALSINESNPNLRVLVALRKELYDNIPSLSHDAEKHSDIIEELSWDGPELLKLISARVRHSVSGLSVFDDRQIWNEMFVSELHGTDSFKYIIDRTLNRPREIILFCSQILKISRNRGIWPIDLAVVEEAERQYSKQRTKDIASEYRFQYPGLLSIFEVFRGGPVFFCQTRLGNSIVKHNC